MPYELQAHYRGTWSSRESNIHISVTKGRMVRKSAFRELVTPRMNVKISGYAYGNRERSRNNSLPPLSPNPRRRRVPSRGKKSICILRRSVRRKEIALTLSIEHDEALVRFPGSAKNRYARPSRPVRLNHMNEAPVKHKINVPVSTRRKISLGAYIYIS